MRFPKPAREVKTRKPLKRSKQMRKRRARRIDRETPVEKVYRAWVHNRPCAARELFGHVCDGPIQMAHFRNMTGLGLKENNVRSIALCRRGHLDEYDQTAGPFAAMGKVGKKYWFECRLIEAHADFALEHGYPVAAPPLGEGK